MRENKTYDELSVGDEASITRVCTGDDLLVFAHASGNLNPLHLPPAAGQRRQETVAPSMWAGALISAVLGNVLPGPGTLYHAQSFRFLGRAHIGDTLTVSVTVLEKRDGNLLRLATRVAGRGGDLVADGEAEVYAPREKIRLDESELPEIEVRRHQHFDRLMATASALPPLRTAIVAPEEPSDLAAALLAAERGLIVPLLIGPKTALRRMATKAKLDLGETEIHDAADPVAATHLAAELAGKGHVAALMKDALHSDRLLRTVLDRRHGLRRGRRLSHVYALDVPGLDHLLMITDAVIAIAPGLEDKVDIVQNAIDLAQTLGIAKPKVGILSAVETVTPSIPSTLDAAILSKMAERGQITGGIVDGPLAMENAMDGEAAQTRGITSLVAGQADILVAPNLEAGNLLAKELVFLSQAHAAGLVVGAKVPIVTTGRADKDEARLASYAIAALYQARSGDPAAQEAAA
ncbi:MAG: bifunctional enoyl-CoA hydratase/phosphate acetyltransferase [Rhodospirillales bacterium]